jgi:hypothetical protein
MQESECSEVESARSILSLRNLRNPDDMVVDDESVEYYEEVIEESEEETDSQFDRLEVTQTL